MLAATAGAMAGCAAFYGTGFDMPFWYGLVGVGLGLLGLAFNRELGLFLLVAGLFFGLAGLQVDREVRRADPVAVSQQRAPDAARVWQAAARKPHWVVGYLREVKPSEDKPNRATLVVEVVRIYNLPGLESVKRARVSVYASQAKDLVVGEGVAVPTLLMPPQGPRAPGERDYRLWQMGGPEEVYGYIRGTVEPTYIPPQKGVPANRVQGWVEQMREQVRVAAAPYAHGVVAALLMGDQRGIPPDIRDAYRLTGLTHLLAISGMQLTLVGGGLFFMLRWLAAFFPTLVLRHNVKAWAALAGLAAAGFYTLLAGASVGVVRAFVMVALLMVAAIVGRLNAALRAWCVAGLVILAVNPMMVMQAGFQLSMAAVLALLLWSLTVPHGHKGVLGWGRELLLASIVAGAATAPLVVLNFGQLSAVGLVANLGAVPLMTVSTYLGMLALLLWPLGLQGPVLALMGVVSGWVNEWAMVLSAWQGNVAVEPRWWGVLAILGVLTILAVMMRHWWGVAACVLAGTLLAWGLAARVPVADVLVLDGGKAGLLRGEGSKPPVYSLLWAESPKGALWLAQKSGLRVQIGDDVAREALPMFLPENVAGGYAWAARYGTRWHLEPVACGRVWQRMDERCWVRRFR